MEAAPAAAPVPAVPSEALVLGAWRPAGLACAAGQVLAHFAGGAALPAALAAAYAAKRRLGVDVFPGVDVLPDREIEASINAAVRLLGW